MSAVTLKEWIESRNEGIPEELVTKITVMVDEQLERTLEMVSLNDVIEREMRRVMSSGLSSREQALDLLAIDAIATYSLELDAERGTGISAAADSMIQTINRLASELGDDSK